MAKMKKVYFSSYAEADRLLRAAKKGKKLLGNGAYANVYSSKGANRVTKIGGLEDAYLHFVELVMQANSKNPFLPKIYSGVIYRASRQAINKDEELEDEGFYVIEMERLQELEDMYGDNYSTVVAAFEQVVEYGNSLNDFVNEHVAETKGITGMFSVKVKLEPRVMQFIKHLRQIVNKACSRHGDASWDIHEGNIMVRKNGQVVLTDPIA
jgi:hypothetical protein